MRSAILQALFAATLAGIFLPAASAEQPPAPAPSAQRLSATPEQIADWVRQLDANEFLTRETAMLALVQVGPAALPALAPVLENGSLEATSRGLFILRQLGSAGDEQTQDVALDLLQRLAQRKETPALARRASATAQEVLRERQEHALTELEKLGARINGMAAAEGILFEEPSASVEIGEDFRGQAIDLRRLKRLHGVPLLVFSGPKISDEWIAHAAAMPNLERLHIYKTSISDAGLKALAEHPSLMELGVYYTPVGDPALALMSKMPRLFFVKLYGTEISAAAAEKYAALDGAAKIDYKLGAFLGVGCLGINGACQVRSVHRTSPAEQAGLLPEDIIVRFGDTKITDFETLMALIAQRHVGDSVEVEVLRRIIDDQAQQALKSIVVTVKLAPWDMEPAIKNGRR